MGLGEPRRNPADGLAARLVGLDGSLGPTVSIAALCRKLRDEEFLPDPLVHEALLTMAGQPIRGDSLLAEQAEMIHERRLHDAVEEFAAEFFSIPVEARIARWNGLLQTSEGSQRQIERLNGLKPGLKIDAESIVDPSPDVQRLINDILALFPMSHARRAAESRARANRFRNDAKLRDSDRSQALTRLRKKHRDIAALSQDYLAGLERSRRTISFRAIRLRIARYLDSKYVQPLSFHQLLWRSVGAFFLLVFGLALFLWVWVKLSAPYGKVPPVSSKPIIRPNPSATNEPKTLNNLLRDEFKGRIRREKDPFSQRNPSP
jgi:hypothetical protein